MQELNDTNTSAKKGYHAPALTPLGTIEQLTQGGSSSYLPETLGHVVPS